MTSLHQLPRCSWPGNNPLMVTYHDTEWGVPVRDDGKLFEFMLLDSFQAGLSWSVILKKREGFREAFAGFDPAEIALFDDPEVHELITNVQIIRNKMKIRAAINNARKFLSVQTEFGTFHHYIWGFVDFSPIVNNWETEAQIPSNSPVSDAMSADLKRRGFKFVGSTICYAFMQAAGLVNDHLVHCFRHPANQQKRQ